MSETLEQKCDRIDSDNQPIRLEKAYDYQLQLTSRRWQYFATYLAITGYMATKVPGGLLEKIIEGKEIPFLPVAILPGGAVFLMLVFSQLISLATKRVYKVERLIGENNSITQLRQPGKAIVPSETTWIYICLSIAALLWVVVSFYISKWFFGVLLLTIIGNLFLLTWRAPE